MAYLYGTSIQGIQKFIFETNKLREITGASELVESLCTTEFSIFLHELSIAKEMYKIIFGAAGNIRVIFNDFDVLSKVVNQWPKRVMLFAPGITVNQAVEIVDENEHIARKMTQLEKHLKEQRNHPTRSIYPTLMSIERCRRTGSPAVTRDKIGNLADLAITRKLNESSQAEGKSSKIMNKIVPEGAEKGKSRIPFEMDDIVENSRSNWIAVIHADGNSLGKILQKMSSELHNNTEQENAYRDFSKALDVATKKAAQSAFGRAILNPHTGSSDMGKVKDWKYPIRPVLLGGDDLTVICRADIAIEFTNEFLIAFEECTRRELKKLVKKYKISSFKKGLTACAGIAFIKSSFPFHYAVDLAESLCSHAKIKAKEINKENVPSCLNFHKVQNSSVSDFNEIIDRELKAADGVSFYAGPYYLNTQNDSSNIVKDLLLYSEQLNEVNSPKSGIRQWLSLLYKSEPAASKFMKRIHDIHDEKSKEILDKTIKGSICLAYDWMTIASFKREGK